MFGKIIDRLIEVAFFHVVRNAVVDLDSDTYLNAVCDKLSRGHRLPGEFGLLIPVEVSQKLAACLLLRLALRTADHEIALRCHKLILCLNQEEAVDELTALLSNSSNELRMSAAKRLTLAPDSGWDASLVNGLFSMERTDEGKAIILGLLTTRPEFLPDFEAESEMWHGLLRSSLPQLQLIAVKAIEAGGSAATCMIRQLLVMEQESSGELRIALVRSIAATLTDQERAIERIIELVNDEDPRIGCTAIAVIPTLGPYAAKAVPALTLAMLSLNPVRREAARKVLEQIGWDSAEFSNGEESEGPSLLSSLKRILTTQPAIEGSDGSRLRLIAAI